MDGVGKTTLVGNLNLNKPNMPISVEIHPENILIKQTITKFDENDIDYYFYQIIFLYANIERYQKIIAEIIEKNTLYGISDRIFLEDIIFAEALLNNDDFNIYKKLFFYHLDSILQKTKRFINYLILESKYETCKSRMDQKMKQLNNKMVKEKSYFDYKSSFYKKLYSLYNNKNSLFWVILEKHSIKPIILNSNNFSSLQTYQEAKKLLSFANV